MRRIAFVLLAALLVAACEKNESVPIHDPSAISLAGSSWLGHYDDTLWGYPTEIDWSLDFNTDSTAELFLEFSVGNQPQQPYTFSFSYSFDGSHGITQSNQIVEDEIFDYHPEDTTITMSLYLDVNEGEARLGGLTTFHPVGR